MKEYSERAFNEGYQAYCEGKLIEDNPYKPSGDERDTKFEDELNFQWYSGWCEAQEDNGKPSKDL